MHIHIVPNRDSPPTVLLRESYREGTKVRKRTLANLSSLSASQVEAIRAVLAGQALQPPSQALEITASLAHGHVHAVALAMQRLDLASLLGAKASRERDLVLAMVAARIAASSMIRSPALSQITTSRGVRTSGVENSGCAWST